MASNLLFIYSFAGALLADVLLFGIIALIVYRSIRHMEADKKKILAELEKKRDELKEKMVKEDKAMEDKKSKIIANFKRAEAISNEVQELVSSVDQPSQNALHSKHKNMAIHKIKQLEAEKYTLLKEVVDMGYNPEIPVQDVATGHVKRMKLSEHLLEIQKNISGNFLDDYIDSKKTKDSKGKVEKFEKNGKTFFVHSNDDDDSDPTIH